MLLNPLPVEAESPATWKVGPPLPLRKPKVAYIPSPQSWTPRAWVHDLSEANLIPLHKTLNVEAETGGGLVRVYLWWPQLTHIFSGVEAGRVNAVWARVRCGESSWGSSKCPTTMVTAVASGADCSCGRTLLVPVTLEPIFSASSLMQ